MQKLKVALMERPERSGPRCAAVVLLKINFSKDSSSQSLAPRRRDETYSPEVKILPEAKIQ
jgi:hypothetical protein